MERNSLIFVTGGVRSGKSRVAEQIAIQSANETRFSLHYIATGVPSDLEMQQRIRRHQSDREESPYYWNTWEQSTNLISLAPYFDENDILLLDCLTTLLNNELFSYQTEWDASFLKALFNRILIGIDILQQICYQVIIVSNEVVYEPSSKGNRLIYTYQHLIGKLHQQLVNRANQAYLVEAGVPILKKGVNG